MEILGGIVGVVLVVLLFVLAIFWLIFPWLVHSQLKSLIEGQERLQDLLRTIVSLNKKMQAPTADSATPLPTSSKPKRPLSVPPPQPVLSPPPVSPLYFFSADGEDSDPHSLDEMRRFRQSGKLTDDTLVVRQGDTEWQPASIFTELCFERDNDAA